MMLTKTTAVLIILITALGMIMSGCGSTGTPTALTTNLTVTTTITTSATTTAAPQTSEVETTIPPTTTAPEPTITTAPEPTTTTITTPEPTTEPSASPTPEPVFALTSTAFAEGQPIPAIHGYYNGNKSPELNWSGTPAATVSFVLIMEDPDGGNWSHWVVFNIPGVTTMMTESVPKTYQSTDGGVMQGTNDFGLRGYDGPSPPSGIHHYYFRLYALDTILNLNAGATREQVRSAMQGHILGETELMGTFRA